MRREAKLALWCLPLAIAAVCIVAAQVSTANAGSPYGSALTAPLTGTEAIPHGCTQTICRVDNKCAKDPGSTTKCKAQGGICTIQGC